MMRERVLKVVLVLVGLLFLAGIYPVAMSLWHPSPSDDTGDAMMLSLYVTLGIFCRWRRGTLSGIGASLRLGRGRALRTRLVMGTMGFEIASERTGFLAGSGVLVAIGVALIALAPAKAASEAARARAA